MLNARYQNWGRTASCRPNSIVAPTSEKDVASTVRTAARRGLRVKVVGAGHSWSPIAMTDGVLVSLDALDGVLAVDRARGQITVEGGMRLARLTEALDSRGLALPVLGSISEQSIAGAISTATHGSSLVWGNLASLVKGLRLVTSTGDVVDLHEGDPRLPAFRVGLGALGIITRVTLAVVPAFRLEETVELVPFERGASEVEGLFRSAEYAKAWWLPHTEVMVTFRYRRTDAEPTERFVARFVDHRVLNGVVFPAFLAAGRRFPARIPELNRAVVTRVFRPGRRVARSDRALNLAMPPVHRETEQGVALERSQEALRALARTIDSEGLRSNFITELRAVPADDAWMSPAYGRDTCQLGAYTGHHAGADRFLRRAKEVLWAHDGRPHWGKELDVSADDVLARWPRAAEFVALRRELDPRGLFSNEFLDLVLGPAG